MKALRDFFLMFVVIVALSIVATYAEKHNGLPNFLEKYIPKSQEELINEKAAEELEAPFAQEENAAQPVQISEGIEYDPLGQFGSVTENLAVPHRHEAAVSKWVTEYVAKAVTFTLPGYGEHMTELDTYMSENGKKEFMAFLEQAKVVGLMQTNNYDARASVLDVPEKMASGVAGGRYRWLYDLDVLLTFLPQNMESYTPGDNDSYMSENLIFRVQIARTEKGQGVDGMVIETWEVVGSGEQ